MTKKYIIIFIILIIVVICAAVGFNMFRSSQDAEKGSVTSNLQTGAPQDSTGSDEDQQGTDSSTPAPPPEKRSNAEILETISKQKPELVDSNGQPVFAVVGATKTKNAWYVVTVRHNNPTVGTAKVILKDNGGGEGLVLIAGPGTYFDPETIALPDEVRKLL